MNKLEKRQEYDRNYKNAQYRANPHKVLAERRARRLRDPKHHVFLTKRSNAKQIGIEFTLKEKDIIWPEVCPVLGIILDYLPKHNHAPQPNSPSFDRINPNKGYIPGNVIIVSNRANFIKRYCTWQELRQISDFYKALDS